MPYNHTINLFESLTDAMENYAKETGCSISTGGIVFSVDEKTFTRMNIDFNVSDISCMIYKGYVFEIKKHGSSTDNL